MKQSFDKWFIAVRKKLHDEVLTMDINDIHYEVLRVYFDPWSGVPMLGLYNTKTSDHVGFPAYQMYMTNYELPYEKEKKEK